MFYYLAIFSVVSACEDFTQESQMLQYGKSLENYEEKCLVLALNQNWLEPAYQILVVAVLNEAEISNEVVELVKKKQKTLGKLNIVNEIKAKFQIVSPAFQWAESPSTVYLDIKPSHRLDAPGCTNMRDPVVEITENSFKFSARCFRSSSKLKLLLEFEFSGKVKVEESTYNFTPVGRLNVTLKKARPDIWKVLVKGKKPNNLHIWWEIREKYSEEIEKITGGDEEDEKPQNNFDELLDNPNVVIENSYINGKYVDNTNDHDL